MMILLLNLHGKIKTWSTTNKAIVVAGSTYLQRNGEYYNTASVFYMGAQYKIEKHKLSPHEVSRISGHGPSVGTERFYFRNSPVGTLGVMICAEEFDRQEKSY